jgi:uncharacterized protein YciI
MRTRVVVTFDAGPTWLTGSVREQPGWDAHAAFVDDLVARGTIVMGGAFADDSGSMILLEGIDQPSAERLLAEDPFIRNGVFVVGGIRTWDVFVDVLTGADAAGDPGPS